MAGKFRRSFALIRASFAILRADPKLLVFPALAMLIVLAIMGSLVAGVWMSGLNPADVTHSPSAILGMGLAAFLASIVSMFFNVALASVILWRLAGRQATLTDGLRLAFARRRAIVGYAVIAIAFALVVKPLEERLGIVGRFIAGFIGLAWAAATLLVAPVLVVHDVGPITAIKQSAGLFRRTWGENVIGVTGTATLMGFLSGFVVIFGVLGSVFVYADAGLIPATIVVAVVIVAVVAISVFGTALNGVFSAVLYRYATNGLIPAGFDGDLLRDSVQRR
jgi:hypothetical protein